MIRRHKSKGQSTIEFAILLLVVIAALLGMARWTKRSVMGKGRMAADQIGEQFSPANFNMSYTTSITGNSNRIEQTYANGYSTTVYNETSTRAGNEGVSSDIANETLF